MSILFLNVKHGFILGTFEKFNNLKILSLLQVNKNFDKFVLFMSIIFVFINWIYTSYRNIFNGKIF